MNATEIIEALRSRLSVPVGRHLYGVLGSYAALSSFAEKLQQAKTPDGVPFPAPLSVNRGILDAMPDNEFRELVADEAKRPEPTAAHIAKAFEYFLRSQLRAQELVVLSNLEMIFPYRVELSLLRTLAADRARIVLLLPAKRQSGNIVMFPETEDANYSLPSNLIAENHLWELRG